MEHPIKTSAFGIPSLAHNNIFAYSFLNEFDSFLQRHPDVRRKSGLINYKLLRRPNHELIINIDDSSCIADKIDENDLIFLIAIFLTVRCMPCVINASYTEYFLSSTCTSEKDLLEAEWINLIGDDNISHTRFIYNVLHNTALPKNLVIPLIKELGIENNVIQDSILSESEFVSKYNNILYLPILFTERRYLAIEKLLKLLTLFAFKSEFAKKDTINFIFDLDDKSLITLSCYFILLKKEYSDSYNKFRESVEFTKLGKQTHTPSITFLRWSMLVDDHKFIAFDSFFHNIHHNSDYEVRMIFTEAIIRFASLSTRIVDLYEHYCSNNGIIPKPEIIEVKNISNQTNPIEEFVNEYKNCRKDTNDELNLGLKLEGEDVYGLYNVLKNGYIDASHTSLYQLCYALTGRMCPDYIEQIEWIASTDDFAIFVNLIYSANRKPVSKLCKIFRFQNPDFNSTTLSSRCSRLENNPQNIGFQNQILAVIKH